VKKKFFHQNHFEWHEFSKPFAMRNECFGWSTTIIKKLIASHQLATTIGPSVVFNDKLKK
jgi:hypothetical protein